MSRSSAIADKPRDGNDAVHTSSLVSSGYNEPLNDFTTQTLLDKGLESSVIQEHKLEQ